MDAATKIGRNPVSTTMSYEGPKSRILEIWNRAIFVFQEKILSYGLEIGPFSKNLIVKNRAGSTDS